MACWLLTLIVVLAAAGVQGEPAIAVITHPDNPVGDIDDIQLRALFGMRLRQWPDGRPAVVFVLPDRDPVHREFCKNRLHEYPYQLRRHWDRLVYSGTGQAPLQVPDLASMLERVASTPGAIGYAPAARVDERVRTLETGNGGPQP